MFDSIIYSLERKQRFFYLFVVIFFVCLLMNFINFVIDGNFLTLILLISLVFSYPVVKFLKKLDRDDVERVGECNKFLKTVEKEFKLFWLIFVSLVFSFCFIFYFFNFVDVSLVFSGLIGFFYKFNSDFFLIFFNNLLVWFFTFFLCVFISSGIVFILVFNSSLLAFFLVSGYFNDSNLFVVLFLIFGHTFFEISGYILVGLAGFLISYRAQRAYFSRYYFIYDKKLKECVKKRDRRNTFAKLLSKNFFVDVLSLILVSLFFVFLGAFLEVL